ncbi:MAG TPA: hypothetical protein VFO67_09230 [Gemmatimonadales bacterium]|nr:hypothetical protein [Gemmatimonadales bacterium]
MGYPERTWRLGVQWTAVVAAALAGFAVTLILTALGAAIGLTAGAASNGVDGPAVGAGALIWWTLSVIAAGIVAGRVLATSAGTDVRYNRLMNGTLAWVLGVIILLFLLANGVGNMIGGLGGGLGAAAATHNLPSGTPADSVHVARTAAAVGSGAAWGLLMSMLLGLGATIMSAGKRAVRPELEPVRSR